MPVPGSIKRITNPEDEDQFVDLRIVDEVLLKHGSGGIFRKHKLSFINHAPNSRIVSTEHVVNRATAGREPVDGPTTDESQYLDVELIERWNVKHGSGGIYQKRTNATKNEIDQEGRETHIVRIHGKDENGDDDPDVWIDVRRTDSFVMKHGSGGTFTRERVFVGWVEPDFDQVTEGLPLVEGPGQGFDPPWRIDPLQEIINVHWKEEVEEDVQFHFLVERIATLGFMNEILANGTARTFWRAFDWSFEVVDGDLDAIEAGYPFYITAFRYIWQTQRPHNIASNANPVWADLLDEPPIPGLHADEITGLPSLPMTVEVPAQTMLCVPEETNATNLHEHPIARWEEPTGEILADEPIAWAATSTQPAERYRRGTSITIKMIGLTCVNSGKRFPVDVPLPYDNGPNGNILAAMTAEVPLAGGTGGHSESGVYPTSFAEQTFDLSAVEITVMRGSPPAPEIWKPVAVALRQIPEEPATPGGPPPGTGAIRVLCKRADDPEWFP